MFKIDVEKHESWIGAIGNILEWYNFALFMPFLPILSKGFFPLENAALREVLTFLTMSSGLFMRPLGSAIFGPIGDKFGRRKAISIAILLMAIPTLLIGLLPTYDQIGILAPILLVFLRIFQGISLGGEYTAAMVHIVEQAPKNRRGFYGSLSDAGSNFGVLLGAQALVALYAFFSENDIYSFAWRIPFWLAAFLIPFAFLIPTHLPEKNDEKSREPVFKSLIAYKKEVVCAISITALSAVGFYTLLTFLPYHLVETNALSLKEATTCSAYATMTFIIFTLIGGYASDLCNNKKFFLAVGAIGVAAVICFIFLFGAASFTQWMTLQLLYGLFLGLYYSTRAAFFSNAFPPHVRCTAVSLSVSLGQAIFGGLTPIVMGYVTDVSKVLSTVPAIFVAICCVWALTILNERDSDE
ncbi:MAG: MFS transporter [Holosporales bacterium]|nr:MFS transporter [Holosporales bacterium]